MTTPDAAHKAMTRKAAATAVLALAFVLSPVVTPGFNGFTADQFPVPQPDPPIQPAGWAFSIWGVIYLWLVASAAFGWLRRRIDPAWDRARWPLIASLAIGTAWIPVANLSPGWATILIWPMLGTALWALDRAPEGDRLWLEAPLGLYAGWLTAASCVATGVWLTGHGAPEILVHTAFLLIAAAIALRVVWHDGARPFYLAAVLWALAGVALDNAAAGRIFFTVLAAALFAALVPVFARNAALWWRLRPRQADPRPDLHHPA